METEGYEGGHHRYNTFPFSLVSHLSLSVFAAKRILSPED
jgi:hypothetical protein